MMGRMEDENLFEMEKMILQSAVDDLSNQQYADNALLSRYKTLANHYKKLLRTVRKAFYISDMQGQVLQRYQNEIQNLLDHANQGFLTFGEDFQVDRQYSAKCISIFGQKISGLSIIDLLGQEDTLLREQLRNILERVFVPAEQSAEMILQGFPDLFRINERNIHVECKAIMPTGKHTECLVVMMILTDITERLKAEEKIMYLSYHDKLTFLYNRAYVEDKLLDFQKREVLPLSMIMTDMNGLKLVNDVFGHQQGDLLLVAMAKVLRQCCRKRDVIARWGGDEFLVLLPETSQEVCGQICQEIQRACEQIKSCAIPLSAAIGMSTKKMGTISFTDMFSLAESRMYNDKLKKRKEFYRTILVNQEARLNDHCKEYTDHCKRVYDLAKGFMAFLGNDLDSGKMELLNKLIRFHDIGKVAISTEILESTQPLSVSQWNVIKSHSEIGYRMAQSIDEKSLGDMILSLHERWDGLGYPYGLKGEEIPFLVRFFALVDIYDVITHERPYGKALDQEMALQEIALGIGTQFDPKLTKAFLQFMYEREAE